MSQAILVQSSKNTSFSAEAEIAALWSGIVQGCVAQARDERARLVVLQESEWCGQAGPSAPFSACVAAATVYCCGASQPLLLLFS